MNEQESKTHTILEEWKAQRQHREDRLILGWAGFILACVGFAAAVGFAITHVS